MRTKPLLFALAVVAAPAAHAQERLFVQVPAQVEPGAQITGGLERCGVASMVGGQVYRNVQQRYGTQTRPSEGDSTSGLFLRITVLHAAGGRDAEGLSIRADLLRNGAQIATNTFGQTLGRGRGCAPIDQASAGVGRQVGYWVPTALASAGGAPSTGGAPSSPPPASPPPSPPPVAPPPSTHSGVVSIALRYLGVPYRWGGDSPGGFDCSGLVLYAFKQAGVTLPRTSYSQWGVGVPVSRANIQAGDLVFFSTAGSGASHVGIATGPNTVISATSHGVMEHSISDAYWGGAWVGARRLS